MKYVQSAVVVQSVFLAATMLLATPLQSHAGQLITAEEAKLPPPKGAVATERRGIMRGPKILYTGPSDATKSPIRLQLKFESYGDAKIDANSVKMTYLRTPNVDLTSRVTKYVQPSGIDMPDAELPPGDYMLRVDLKDSDGRPASTSFTLKIAP
ncbi:hypothetical protein [Bradyrhizobium sp. SYSU BS000235]|uniref:hypothetical protein n=1 Tax=Bradyrhizobium sp. SYSU BS000235 TaxID=3411332 RepID=UPI003C794EB8